MNSELLFLCTPIFQRNIAVYLKAMWANQRKTYRTIKVIITAMILDSDTPVEFIEFSKD